MMKVQRLRQRSWMEHGRLIEAAVLLSFSELAIHLLPFRWLTRLGGTRGSGMSLALPQQDEVRVRRVSWAVQAAARRLPWSCRCLAQALTARLMLARCGLGTTLYIGVRLEAEGALSSHAWLRCGSLYVTGAPQHLQFRIITIFGKDESSEGDLRDA